VSQDLRVREEAPKAWWVRRGLLFVLGRNKRGPQECKEMKKESSEPCGDGKEETKFSTPDSPPSPGTGHVLSARQEGRHD